SAMYQANAMNLTPEDLAGGRRHAGDKIGADGSAMYQANAMDMTVDDLAGGRRHAGDKIGADGSAMYQANAMDMTIDDLLDGGRRHAGDKIGGDGSAMYQANAMHPTDWSYKSSDAGSIGDSTIDETNDSQNMPNQYIFKNNMNLLLDAGTDDANEDDDREAGNMPDESTRTASASASRQLIDDLVWLEKKIERAAASGIDTVDSMSFDDNTDGVYEEETSNDDSIVNENPALLSSTDVHATNSAASSIVCKDCFAPPGKLHIVIHSTKDGPAVHTVKEGSKLEGELYPGDLIISVDNVDTRSFTAEQVMKMMATKGDKERKITVLHFHEEA
ncbi:MAG: hypothetical protein ACI90V_013314, partial [Bacillariaceae sp.]